MKIIRRLEKIKDTWFLIGIIVIFFFLRLPSLFEPYWYGDEGIYEVIGYGMRQGRMLYTEIFDNKPPLLYILYAVFNGDQFSLRFLSLLFGMGSIFVFHLLVKKLFLNHKTIYVLTLAYAFLFGTPIFEGNIANAENFMHLPILLSAYILYSFMTKSNESESRRKTTFSYTSLVPTHEERPLVLAGVVLSLAFLLKIVAIFDFAAFCAFIAIDQLRKRHTSIVETGRKVIAFVIGFAPLILLTFFFFFVVGAFSAFFYASFLQNIGYVGYGNRFIFPQGLLFLKLFLLSSVCLWLYTKRKAYTTEFLFVVLWFCLSLFNAFFSQRPYTHYLLVLLPAYILLCGLAVYEKRLRIALIIVLLGTGVLLYQNFNYYKKNMLYYENFLSFVTGKKETNSYYAFFDSNTPHDYVLASFLKTHTTPSDTIFIWGNNAQVYKLSGTLPPGRFTVAYHMTATQQTLDETEQAIATKRPKYIIVIDQKKPLPFRISGYDVRMNIEKSILYERTL